MTKVESATVLDIRGMSKTFPGQVALRDVSLEIRAGEVHGLVGANGSGQSTLIKCLAGYHHPDPGARVWLDGTELPLRYTPSQARGFGLSFMHQDLGLIPSLSVLENLALGSGFNTGPLQRIRWRAEHRRAAAELAAVGEEISPDTLVRHLSKADQTLVALARVLAEADTRVVVFDEPTSALTPSELPRLFDSIRVLVERGAGVLYVSHRLGEITELCDRVTVLRDGRKVVTQDMDGVDEQGLVKAIVGADTAIGHPRPSTRVAPGPDTPARIRATGLSGPGVEGINFELRQGEILGIAGLLGSGRTELARLLFGATPRTAGEIWLDGEPVDFDTPAKAIANGVALVPEDRLAEGIVPTMTVRQNMTLLELGRYWNGVAIRRGREISTVEGAIKDYDIRPALPEREVRHLSGGNQQKVVLAKWMRIAPKVLILDEPTQGIDVGAKAEVARIVEEVVADGMSVIMIDSDFSNLVELCDRLLVMAQGKVVATLAREEMTRDRILGAAYTSAPKLETEVANA